ncbi:MAG: hypothetical protein LUQ01_05600 [Methanolinea sp.]|nr:hypothetical protein [Methanolinea sp.]
MHLVDALREYLGWCPDHRMAQVRKHILWNETNYTPLPTGGAYVNDGVIVDYGKTGISLPYFIGIVFGVIGILALFVLVVPFAGLRMVFVIVLCFLILPIAIVTLVRDLRKATMEITNEALVIRRFLHRPVVIRKEEIATLEVRDNVPPIPVWLQAVLMLVLIPASSAGIIYREYLQFASGEITTSSFFQYLGFYPSIVLFFLASYYHSRIRSHHPRFLFLSTTTKKVAGIYGKNPEEIAAMLVRPI